MAKLIQGTFSAPGVSAVAQVFGSYNLSLAFAGTGSVDVQRTFDNGSTWETIRTITNASDEKILVGTEPERRVKYRLNCSAAAAAITYRLGSDGFPV